MVVQLNLVFVFVSDAKIASSEFILRKLSYHDGVDSFLHILHSPTEHRLQSKYHLVKK